MSRSFPKFSFSLSFQVTGKADGVCGGNILFNVSSATMVNARNISYSYYLVIRSYLSCRSYANMSELFGLPMYCHASLTLNTEVNLGQPCFVGPMSPLSEST